MTLSCVKLIKKQKQTTNKNKLSQCVGVCVSTDDGGVTFPGAGVTGICEPSDVGAGN